MKFFKSSVLTFGGNLTTGVISLVLAIIFSRTLGAEGKGVVTILVLIPSMVGLALDLGISIANVYFLRSKNISKDILFTNSMVWALSIGVIGAGGTLFFLKWKYAYDFDSDSLKYLIAAALVPMFLFLALQRRLLLSTEKIVSYNLNNILQPTLILVCSLLFLLFNRLTVTFALFAYFISLLLLSLLIVKALKVNAIIFRLQTLIDSVKFGFFGHIGTVTQQFNFRVDVLILAALSGDKAVGLYSVAYTCAEVLLRFPRAIGTILFPKVSGLTEAESNRLTTQVFKLCNFVLIFLTLFSAVGGYFLIPMLFGKEFALSINPFLFLLPGVYFFGWNNVLIEDLKGRGHPNYKLYTAGLALVFMVCLDFILIPDYSLIGASIASSIAYTISGLFSLYLFCKKTKNPIRQMLYINKHDLQYLTKQLRKIHLPRTIMKKK